MSFFPRPFCPHDAHVASRLDGRTPRPLGWGAGSRQTLATSPFLSHRPWGGVASGVGSVSPGFLTPDASAPLMRGDLSAESRQPLPGAAKWHFQALWPCFPHPWLVFAIVCKKKKKKKSLSSYCRCKEKKIWQVLWDSKVTSQLACKWATCSELAGEGVWGRLMTEIIVIHIFTSNNYNALSKFEVL